MRICRLRIQNFRNFRDVDCRFGQHAVIIGENGVGKSNLLSALRILLDTTLPDANRILSEEDFWDGGLAFAGTKILISVDLTDYSEDPSVLACLADYEIDPEGYDSSVSRLTYVFMPSDTVNEADYPSASKDEYSFAIYGGDNPSNTLPYEIKRYLGFRVLGALRDAEADLQSWKRSPLRPLLEGARNKLSKETLEAVVSEMDRATEMITHEQPLTQLTSEIGGRLNKVLGTQHDLVPSLGFNSTNHLQLIQSLRLFVDKKRHRQVSETSLGLANVLYISLVLLQIEDQERSRVVAATILGIEEPEAHLHPQMQRVVFRDLLRSDWPVLVTTHSPNIVSVAPLESLVLLRTVNGECMISSLASAGAFTDDERMDLERYLDVTRAEIVFGRGVILVEGDAEKFIVPAAAALLPTSIALDDFGITVCSVGGTDFTPHVKLLNALGIPFVILTDGDKRDDVSTSTSTPGIQRGVKILQAIEGDTFISKSKKSKEDETYDPYKTLAKKGVFVGVRTLETDLVLSGSGERMKEAFRAILPTSREATATPFLVSGTISDAAEDAIISLVERVGKGRFAQRFSALMATDDIPGYIRDAIEMIVTKCSRV